MITNEMMYTSRAVWMNDIVDMSIIIFNFKVFINLLQSVVKFEMQQQEICELLKEIIPELEAKIKQEMINQYQHKIIEIKHHYESEIQKILERQNKLKQVVAQLQKKEDDKDRQELCKRVAVLQSQRKNWCRLETQYQSTIQELTNFLGTWNGSKKQKQLNQSNYQGESTKKSEFNSISLVHPPPRTSISHLGTRTVNSNDENTEAYTKWQKTKIVNKGSVNESLNSSMSKYIKQSKEQEKRDEQKQPQNHYRSILSPPKQSNLNNNQTKRIFWDDNKKKQLLSLIKLA